jgi:hypothetical protein
MERSPTRTDVNAQPPDARLPNLLLAGIGKAGTTSMFWHLSQHPDICPSRVKEPLISPPENDEGAEGSHPARDLHRPLRSGMGA